MRHQVKATKVIEVIKEIDTHNIMLICYIALHLYSVKLQMARLNQTIILLAQ